jgi:phosphonate transport system substrate-binding protein
LKTSKTRFALKLTALAAVSALLLSGCSSQPAEEKLETLVFAGIDLATEPASIDTYRLLIETLEEDLGVKVEFFEATDYTAIVEGLLAGRIHVAQISALPYLNAREMDPNISLIGVLSDGPGKPLGSFSYGFTKGDSSIQSLADLKGKTVCYSDPISTSGFLYPVAGIQDAGLDGNPDTTEDMEIVFTGSSSAVVFAVDRGDCDAGFVNNRTYKRLLSEAELEDNKDVRVFWESELIPDPPLVVRSDLPNDLASKITEIALTKGNKTALIAAGKCTEEACDFLTEIRWGWEKAPNDFFDGLIATCKNTNTKACE